MDSQSTETKPQAASDIRVAISPVAHGRLVSLAYADKRGLAKQLEWLIDREHDRQAASREKGK